MNELCYNVARNIVHLSHREKDINLSSAPWPYRCRRDCPSRTQQGPENWRIAGSENAEIGPSLYASLRDLRGREIGRLYLALLLVILLDVGLVLRARVRSL